MSWALAFRGRSLIERGRVEEGLALVRQTLAELRATGAVESTPMLLTWLAEAYATLGQPAEAQSCLADATQFVETTDQRVDEAELLRVPGDLLKAAGDQSGAERHYRQAIAVRAAKRKALPIAGIDQPRPALARPRQARGSP